ncbi:MAG: LD-carboxypeptidase [Alphaproteobacteria bacterium]|nr:LD-carboxypeptidase [Alphaproteobacteria bacterium]
MKKLRAGDKVAVIAPSGQIGNIEKIQDGLKYLSELGLVPVLGKHTLEQYRYMAGTDKHRAQDVNDAFKNPEIKAIFCVRAAAGAARILPYIDYDNAKKNKKPLIGFCDNAALQIALLQKSGIISWNGFLLSYDFRHKKLDKLIDENLQTLISGNKFDITSGTTLRRGKAKGKLICSNLSVLMKLAGTPYFPNLNGKILLIEDTHERLHKIDLMLQQLKQQATFSKLRGLIFGNFTDCTGDAEDGTLQDCFNDFMQGINIPVLQDFQFGHTDSRYVLPQGGTVLLDADKGKLEVLSY